MSVTGRMSVTLLCKRKQDFSQNYEGRWNLINAWFSSLWVWKAKLIASANTDSFSEVSGTFFFMRSILDLLFFTKSNHRLETLPPKTIPIVSFKQLEKCLILKNYKFPKLHRGDCKRADPKPWRIQLASVFMSIQEKPCWQKYIWI